jgi:hypothetical protein
MAALKVLTMVVRMVSDSAESLVAMMVARKAYSKAGLSAAKMAVRLDAKRVVSKDSMWVEMKARQ